MLQLTLSVHWASWKDFSQNQAWIYNWAFEANLDWRADALIVQMCSPPQITLSPEPAPSPALGVHTWCLSMSIPPWLCPCRRSPELLRGLRTKVKGELRTDWCFSLWTQCSPGNRSLMSSGSETPLVSRPHRSVGWPCSDVVPKKETTLVGWHCWGRAWKQPGQVLGTALCAFPPTPSSSCNILWASDMA